MSMWDYWPLTWHLDMRHIPFTTYMVYGDVAGHPILLVYYILFGGFLLYLLAMYMHSKNTYGGYLYTKYGYILIGGKFNNGKTRLLAQFASDVYEKANTFVISNYYNAYSFISFSSFVDFVNILDDLLLLGEYQNFTGAESKKIEEKFPDYFSNEDRKIFEKYKYIPTGGKEHCDFLLEGDEFHQYLYARNSISNFSGEIGEHLLQTMHQVRHYNTLCVLATQDLDDLDNKLRRLASYEIDTLNYWGIFFGYNFFHYFLNKRKTQKEDDKREFRQINKFPILFVNTYTLNFFIDDFERAYNGIAQWGINLYNKKFEKNIIFRKRMFERFKTLDFESKFNVKLDKDIYVKGDLFRKLNEHYRRKAKGQLPIIQLEEDILELKKTIKKKKLP